MHYPSDLQEQVNIYRKYAELAYEEWRIGNKRQAATLYRRGRKLYPEPNAIPTTIRKYAELLEQ